ncbi:magnesium chelatase [Sporomusa termitida]|uniref:Cob-chelat-sub: cobaltochelatase subunit n=1 Tax=Sporomusa termitida TaxID=2377 RepID=A0A517E0N4_9FIRM|nr:magnesium chelatase [Sporomusa termitida]QDR83165.1 Cob-chelat-sub: cobaltochelatase subunit [Sporomusa termitida]
MSRYFELSRHSGNQELFRVVEMSVAALLADHPFHILAEGLHGTGKTTIFRAARELLPPIKRIKNCLYNCDPARPHCPLHRDLPPPVIAEIGIEEVPRPFLEISQAAKVGSVVGSIDLARLTDPVKPLAALLPGTIPRAHRGIIFIDGINRLADTAPEVAEVLLDVMGTRPGQIQMEEPGLPAVTLPVAVGIWAASNPDEEPGPLSRVRKQLSDRFDLTVAMGRPDNYQAVVDILAGSAQAAMAALPGQLAGNLANSTVSPELRQVLAKIYIDFRLDSPRGAQAMETAARLTALLSGRSNATVADLAQVVSLALAHRVSGDTITAITAYLTGLSYPQSQRQGQQDRKLEDRMLSRWVMLWAAVKRQLAAVMRARCHRPAAETSEGGKGAGAGGPARIVDPLATTIIAPPKPAIPIANLPDDQLVTRDTHAHG